MSNLADSSSIRFDEILRIDTARSISEKFIHIIPPNPGGQRGRGIIVVGGGLVHFPNAWVCINMLRRVGCKLPIELWYLGSREVNDYMKSILSQLNVICIDALQVRLTNPALILNGWELKPYAILHSNFKEVLLLDADNVAVVDPTFLFETNRFQDSGAIFWPDYWKFKPEDKVWDLFGVDYRYEPQFESGQIVIDKERCWKALRLAMWYNEHSDFYYRYVYGDKKTFHMAFRKLEQRYSMPQQPIERLVGTMCQHDFDGRRLFQHRNTRKWSLFTANERIDGFLLEDECRSCLRDLRKLWGIEHFALFTDPARAYATSSELLETTFSLSSDDRELRLLRFREDGTLVGRISEEEFYWDLEETLDESSLKLSSEISGTYLLKQGSDRIWRGRKTPGSDTSIELTPMTCEIKCRHRTASVLQRIRAIPDGPELPCSQKGFLPIADCDVLIRLINRYVNRNVFRGSTPCGPRRVEIPARFVKSNGFAGEASLLQRIRQRCQTAVEAIYDLTTPVFPEYMMLQANYPGDGHLRHADNTRYDETTRRWTPNHTPQRVIACNLYLNECGLGFSGGELRFPSHGKMFSPRPGMFVTYPCDERFQHEVPAVRCGSRYSVLLWFTQDKTLAEAPLDISRFDDRAVDTISCNHPGPSHGVK